MRVVLEGLVAVAGAVLAVVVLTNGERDRSGAALAAVMLGLGVHVVRGGRLRWSADDAPAAPDRRSLRRLSDGFETMKLRVVLVVIGVAAAIKLLTVIVPR